MPNADPSITPDDLRAFVASLPIREEGYLGSGDWSVHIKPGFDDFNKETVQPGGSELPDGACGVRSDDDFWTEAVLPFRFSALTIREIVAVLWPDVTDPKFGPDTPDLTPKPKKKVGKPASEMRGRFVPR